MDSNINTCFPQHYSPHRLAIVKMCWILEKKILLCSVSLPLWVWKYIISRYLKVSWISTSHWPGTGSEAVVSTIFCWVPSTAMNLQRAKIDLHGHLPITWACLTWSFFWLRVNIKWKHSMKCYRAKLWLWHSKLKILYIRSSADLLRAATVSANGMLQPLASAVLST